MSQKAQGSDDPQQQKRDAKPIQNRRPFLPPARTAPNGTMAAARNTMKNKMILQRFLL
jgi:hypothetical protein